GELAGGLGPQLKPPRTPATPCLPFPGVSKLRRPSWSSGPKSPQVEPSGLRFHRGDAFMVRLLGAIAGNDFAPGQSPEQDRMPANRVRHSRRMSEKGPDSALRPHDRSCLVSRREFATTAGRGTAICARAAKTVLPPPC